MRDEQGRISALTGVRVLDLSEGVAGPYATSMLGDLGADVIKVERPEGDWGRTSGSPVGDEFSTCFIAMNRNKRDIALDLRHPAGQDIARRLVSTADVVISNFRPGVMERLGLGYDDCVALNERIIYCSISAYGDTGPNRELPGNDTVMQGVSGMMELIGEQDGPPLRVGFPLIDTTCGLFAAQSILAALYARSESSRGVKLDVSLLNTALALQALPLTEYLAGDHQPTRSGNQNPALSPAGAFRTSDRRYLTLAAVRDKHWRSICSAIGQPELAADPRFHDNAVRVANRAVVNAILESALARRTRDEWLAALRQFDVPCAPINTYDDIVGDLSLVETTPIGDRSSNGPGTVITIGNPVRFDGHFPPITQPAPGRGSHTGAVLCELGFDEHEILAMAKDGAVRIKGR